ncbi:hypothetical protein [Sphingomonas natans]|nr:hypothetical protein [Sphingomonas sp. BIUV-7]
MAGGTIRHLWLGFALAFAIMVAGFWPTAIGGAGGPLDGLRIVHGTLAATWMAMLVAQSWLAGWWRLTWHRRIGWSSVAIVPALVLSSILVVQDELRHSTYFAPDLRITLTWLDLCSLVLFCGLWAAAIATRRRWQRHARWVGCTVLVVLPPVLGRLLGGPFGSLTAALPPTYAIVSAIPLALIVRDRLRGGYPLPYAITFAGIAAPAATMFAAPHWVWFVAFCEAIGPVG